MALPIMTDENDVDAIVAYLKTKPIGATMTEAKSVLESKLLDGRKLNAYRTWGFVSIDGERIKLTERGRDISRASIDLKKTIYRNILREQKPYYLFIERTFYQKFDEITASEVAAYWYENCRDEVGSDNESTLNYQVTCFFNIAQSAGLGTYTIGRRGQPTRFTVDKDAIGQFIGETGIVGVEEPIAVVIEDTENSDAQLASILDMANISKGKELVQEVDNFVLEPTKAQAETIKVFISHSKNMNIVDQIKTMLEVADLEYELAVEEETTAIPVPEKVLTGMRRCNSAIICVTADDNSQVNGNSSYSVNENVLIEIGAAFVLYDRRVVLVWDRRLRVPSNLQGLYRCEFEGDELSWSSGMKLLKAIQNFKTRTS